MDQTKKIPDPEDFTKNVDSTIDELFSATRQIEIDPLTSKVKGLSQDKTDQGLFFQVVGREEKHPEEIQPSDTIEMESPDEQIEIATDEKILELDSELELEEKETEAVNLEQQFSRLNQMLLTLEWEVTQTQVVSAKNLIETIRKNPKIEADKNLHEPFSLMIRILEGMADHPEKMPTFGPETLQKGLDTLKNLVWNKEQDPKAKEQLLISAKKGLESAIDIAVPEVAHEVSGEAVSEQLVEDIDDPEPRHQDAPGIALKEKSPDQQEQVTDSVLGADIQEKAGPPELEFPEYPALVDAVKSHIKVLDDCIGYILPVEKLLARTPGMEKLHNFQQNLKSRLEKQKEILEKALAGDYEPSVDVRDYAAQRTEDITIEIDKKEKTPSSSVSCPWHELIVTQWDQNQVALAPEDIAFAGTAPWWAKKGLNKLKTFKLKKLKTWPWTKLQPLMQGTLSNQGESQLIKLEFPVLQKSISSFSYSQPSDNPIVLVLSHADKGLVLMLDSPLKTISVDPEYSWEPSAENNGPWVGNLKIENKQTSVATLESLLNTLTNG
ncbi:MAG: hypothetical protein DRP37_02890 [Thermodesulfobacteriota bacterium]|nr:MAG: hypothetical protein DRP37_02890 [Thermodesulfobacteriota bacterium]